MASTLPDEVDWRQKGALNPAQDQGTCGSCWSFSSIATIESAHFIQTGKLLKLSEQQLVDCDKTNAACNGGDERLAFQYAKKHAIGLEKDYGYKGKKGECKDSDVKHGVKVVKYTGVKPNSVSALKRALVQGPVNIGIDANGRAFSNYDKGVFNPKRCGTT